MKYTKFLFAALLITAFFSMKSYGQDMTPPKPVENKSFDAMVGTWTGESVAMGMTSKMELNIHWALNHQFLIVDLKGVDKDNPNMTYTGLGIYGIDEKGNVKNWWFDDWGLYGIATGTGTCINNKLDVTGSNEIYKEVRTFQVNGNDAVMKATGSYKINGQEIPFEETGTYKRK